MSSSPRQIIIKTLETFMSAVEIVPIKKQTTTIIFLHGNPTSSFLWRNVLKQITSNPANNDLRLIAPDLVGHGKSGIHPNYPSFASHYRFLDSFLQQVLAPHEKAFFCLHDWGSALGFNWIAQNPTRALGLVHMESIVATIEGWDEFPKSGAKVFKLFRESPGSGEEMVLQKNFFLERLYKGEKSDWTPEEEAIVGERFKDPVSRFPTLAWPREIPIRGTNVIGRPDGEPNTIPIVDAYHEFLKSSTQLPKLFINAKPGFFSPLILEKTKNWKNHKVVGPVKGMHFVQETAPVEIADFTIEFVRNVLSNGSKL
jgi:pimeloyl-ACP methyl ester carboxylesterase